MTSSVGDVFLVDFFLEHRAAAGLGGQHGARLDGHAVQVDGTGAALRCIAADVGTGQATFLAQEFNQQRAVFDLAAGWIPVHLEFNSYHKITLRRWPAR